MDREIDTGRETEREVRNNTYTCTSRMHLYGSLPVDTKTIKINYRELEKVRSNENREVTTATKHKNKRRTSYLFLSCGLVSCVTFFFFLIYCWLVL